MRINVLRQMLHIVMAVPIHGLQFNSRVSFLGRGNQIFAPYLFANRIAQP
jgi:hypothetical protein